MAAHHIRRWADASQTTAEGSPLCGQANTHSSAVIAAGDQVPESVTCVRCRKLAAVHVESARAERTPT